MCYPKPGPRCSNHAYNEYATAKNRLNELLNVYEVDGPNGDNQYFYGNKFYDEGQITELLRKASIQYRKAETIYSTTPQALTEYERQAEEAEANGYQLEADLLRAKKRAGETLRKRQLAVYHLSKAQQPDTQQYNVDEKNSGKVVSMLKKIVGGNNIYPGKQTVLSDEQKNQRKYQHVQSRVDVLLSYFENSNGNIYVNDEIVKIYDEENLTPGFKHIGSGSYQSAYLDEKTGYVYKISVDVDEENKDEHRYNSLMTVSGRVASEQKSFAVLNVEKLADNNIEYVETMFYRGTQHPQFPVVVQQYLNDDDYMQVYRDNNDNDTPLEDDDPAKILAEFDGLWDVNENNYRVHRRTGKIVLFDCLDIE